MLNEILWFFVGAAATFAAIFPPLYLGGQSKGDPDLDEVLLSFANLPVTKKHELAAEYCPNEHCGFVKDPMCNCIMGYRRKFTTKPENLAAQVSRLQLAMDKLKEETASAQVVQFDPYDTFMTQLVAKVRLYRTTLQNNQITVPDDKELLIVPLAQGETV